MWRKGLLCAGPPPAKGGAHNAPPSTAASTAGALDNVALGNEIVIGGGLMGRITRVSDDSEFLAMEISEGTEVSVQKNAVAAVLPKGTIKSI